MRKCAIMRDSSAMQVMGTNPSKAHGEGATAPARGYDEPITAAAFCEWMVAGATDPNRSTKLLDAQMQGRKER